MPIKTGLFVIFQFVIVGACLEGVSSYFLRNTENALYRTRRILQIDTQLGWRARPNLQTTFEGVELATDSNSRRIEGSESKSETGAPGEVLTLGPSSAFGWGVPYEKSYAVTAAKQLGLRPINASQIGYSSFQGRLLWQEIASDRQLKPKIVFLAYGINDLDRFRFYGTATGSDQDFFSQKPLQLSLLNGVEKYSEFLTFFSLGADEMKSYFNCQHLVQSELRSNLRQYIENMQSLVTSLKNQDALPVVINTPFYFPQSPRPEFREEINRLYGQVRDLATQDQCRRARIKLREAKQLEPMRIAEDVLELNRELISWTSREKIVHIDAAQLLTDPEHFVDPVHPSAAGHDLITRAILSGLEQAGADEKY